MLRYKHFIFCTTASFIEQLCCMCVGSVSFQWEKWACSLQVFHVDLPACMLELAPQVCCLYSKWTVRRLNLAEMLAIARVSLLNMRTRHSEMEHSACTVHA